MNIAEIAKQKQGIRALLICLKKGLVYDIYRHYLDTHQAKQQKYIQR